MRLGQAVCYGIEQVKEIVLMTTVFVAAAVIRIVAGTKAAEENRNSPRPHG
jgi:hypothetical protein